MSHQDLKILKGLANQFGVELTVAQLEQFETYYAELVVWNERVNLTAITECDEVQVRHFADSLAVLLATDPQSGATLIDIGAGAGFPGLPLKIARPGWHITLLEATRKKTEFLDHVVDALGLTDVDVVWARAEDVGQDPGYRGRFELAVARAVAGLAVLAEYALPLLCTGGRFIAQKGTYPQHEVREAAAAVATLGGQHVDTLPYRLPGHDEPLHLVILEKVAATPDAYPRRPGMPEKRPLK